MIRLLACADVHLGRRSTHIEAEQAVEFTPVALWRRVVQQAIDEGVDAVTVSGDLVDEQNAFYEAFDPVVEAGRRLAEAGIPLLLVGGNHDADVLGRLADEAGDSVTVLGRRGTWEFADVSGSDGERVRVFGWSFPGRAVHQSPVPEFPADQVEAGVTTLGLLHAELGATGGPYCPVSRAELAQLPVNAWILGHLHGPASQADLDADPVIMYTGSLQGLDPGVGERGLHGPWLIECSARGLRFAMLPLAPVVYDECTIDVSGTANVGQLQSRIVSSLRTWCEDLMARAPAVRCLALRLVLSGRTVLRRDEIDDQLRRLQEAGGVLPDVALTVDDWSLKTLPEIDFAQYEDESTPLGVAIRMWRELQGERPLSGATERCIVETEEALAAFGSRTYAVLGKEDGAPPREAVRAILAEQTERLIEALHGQKEAGHAG